MIADYYPVRCLMNVKFNPFEVLTCGKLKSGHRVLRSIYIISAVGTYERLINVIKEERISV